MAQVLPVRISSIGSKAGSIRRPVIAALALAGAALCGGIAAHAQDRDPAYAAARSAGKVGEKVDGYLGVVEGGDPALRKMVDDINIRRKAVYAERAQTQHATVEEYAFTSGCQLILQTRPGEKYQAAGGAWATRGAGAPSRDPRCP